MSDAQILNPSAKTSAAQKTDQSGGQGGVIIGSSRHPKQTKPRPWITIPMGRNGKRNIGVDGLTVEDMTWVFDPIVGGLRIGQVPWKPARRRSETNPLVGGFEKPVATGPCIEVRNGLVGFSFEEACTIYDEAERGGEPVKNCVLRRMDPDSTTMDQKREIIQAPNVYVMPDREFVAPKKDNRALDAEIEKIVGTKKVS